MSAPSRACNPRAYQPERTDLLINTRWGEPKDQYSKAEAKALGRVKWSGRWVTPDERRQLQRQKAAYQTIRQMSGLCFLGAIITAAFLFTQRPPLLIVGPGIGFSMIYGILWVVLVTIAGVGLWQFKVGARTLVTVMLVFDMLLGLWACSAAQNAPALAAWPISRVLGLLLVGGCLYWGKYQRMIFATEGTGVPPTSSDRAASPILAVVTPTHVGSHAQRSVGASNNPAPSFDDAAPVDTDRLDLGTALAWIPWNAVTFIGIAIAVVFTAIAIFGWAVYRVRAAQIADYDREIAGAQEQLDVLKGQYSNVRASPSERDTMHRAILQQQHFVDNLSWKRSAALKDNRELMQNRSYGSLITAWILLAVILSVRFGLPWVSNMRRA